jgi:hypothetical protein
MKNASFKGTITSLRAEASLCWSPAITSPHHVGPLSSWTDEATFLIIACAEPLETGTNRRED